MTYPSRRTVVGSLLPLCAVVAFPKIVAIAAPLAADPQLESPSGLTVAQIVGQLDEKNRMRALALRRFEGTRIYRMHYQGFFGTREAEMLVGVKSSPDDREFRVDSQSGSKFIIDHIFAKLLEGEKEAAARGHRERTALNANNYDFTLSGFDTTADPAAYVLDVIPKTDEKFLYRGRIWVDAEDFAVVRIQAEPAKSPSIWVKKTQINHKYEKIKEFWLPAENRTDSFIRFGGHALLSIEYHNYKITEAGAI